MAPPRLGDGSAESFAGEIDGSESFVEENDGAESFVEENDGVLKLSSITGGGT